MLRQNDLRRSAPGTNRLPKFSEPDLRAICEEEVEIADDFDGYSPRLLVEHIAHCYKRRHRLRLTLNFPNSLEIGPKTP